MDPAPKSSAPIMFLPVGIVLLMMVSGLAFAFVPFIECPDLYWVYASVGQHRLWGVRDCVYCGGRTDPDHHKHMTVFRWCKGRILKLAKGDDWSHFTEEKQ
jgi:hypothetical protein